MLGYLGTTHLVCLWTKSAGFNIKALFSQEVQKDEKTDYYEEFSVTEFYFTVRDRDVEVRSDWTDIQKSVIHNCGAKTVLDDKGVSLIMAVDYINIPICVKNIGLGSAVHFRIGVKPKNSNGY